MEEHYYYIERTTNMNNTLWKNIKTSNIYKVVEECINAINANNGMLHG